MRRWALRLASVVILLVGLVVFGWGKTSAQTPGTTVFTPATLAQFDGKNGHRAYVAYKGVVYDMTGLPDWGNGEHYGNLAGQDLTAAMSAAPHGEDVLRGVPIVGTFQAEASTPTPTVKPATAAATTAVPTVPKPWYAAPIRIFNLSILAWTGILLAVFFVLNFATCFALPWSNMPLPWKGTRPGPDPLDVAPAHQRWTSVHKYFAWGTVILGVVHGLIGFMQLLGYRI